MPESQAKITTETTSKRLIHWAGTPSGICSRKDSGVDVRRVSPRITETGEASYYGNVTCWRCRRAHNAAYSRKSQQKGELHA